MSTSETHFSARHLFYLIRMYRAKFDSDLRAGRYADDSLLRRTISGLFRFGMITYDGNHSVFSKGVETIKRFIGDEDEKSLLQHEILLEIFFGDFDARLQAGKIEDDIHLTIAISELLEKKLIKYNGSHSLTPAGTDRVMSFIDTIPVVQNV